MSCMFYVFNVEKYVNQLQKIHIELAYQVIYL